MGYEFVYLLLLYDIYIYIVYMQKNLDMLLQFAFKLPVRILLVIDLTKELLKISLRLAEKSYFVLSSSSQFPQVLNK